MAGTCSSIRPRLIGASSSTVRLINGAGVPFSVRISTRTRSHGGGFTASVSSSREEGPSCIFVGPIDSARKETLEALYRQAKNAYYNGKPLIVDDMFDRVELKLRWYGSKSVVKYPRCSLLRQSTYADAEDDASQVLLLATIWILILLFGSSACVFPSMYGLGLVYGGDPFDSGLFYSSSSSSVPLLTKLNGILLTVLGPAFGYPIASSAVRVLEGLWRNDLTALKGDCPNCGEEVQIFTKPSSFSFSSFCQILSMMELLCRFLHSLDQINQTDQLTKRTVMSVSAPWSSVPKWRNLRRYWVENGYTGGYTSFHGLGEVGVPSIHSSDKDQKFWGMVSILDCLFISKKVTRS